MKKLIFILGAPGSGKTTDASIVAKRNDNIVHYSIGNMLRHEVKMESKLGQEVATYIDNGVLVPLDIIIDTIVSMVNKASVENILIDGFPRSKEQAIVFDEILKNDINIQLIAVIEVRVSEQIAHERVLGRQEKVAPEEQRADDNDDVFKERMRIYIDYFADILAFYTEKNLLKVISGEGTIEQVVSEMGTFITSRIREFTKEERASY